MMQPRTTEVICGIDEAGRGSIAGPMIVAAVAIFSDQVIKGVRDSKKVKTDKERNHLFERICASAIWKGARQLEPFDIDANGISRCWSRAVTSLILECQEKLIDLNPRVIIDGRETVKHPRIRLRVETMVKADVRVLAVSAASIIAKFGQVCWAYGCAARHLDESGEDKYGFRSHRGYGTDRHREAIAKYGLIDDEHRRTFIKSAWLPQLHAVG